MNNTGHNNKQNSWSDAWPALLLLLLHTVCCIVIALFLLLGGAGLSALLASRGFWAIAIGILAFSAGGYWYLKHKKGSSCETSNPDEKNRSTRVNSN